MSYHHILVAVDLTKDSHRVLERAIAVSQRNEHAKISIMHTLEPLGFAYGGDIPMDLTSIQDQLDDHAKKRLSEIATPHVKPEDQHVVVGMPDTEIHRFANDRGVDLIVVGSHGRHGFALLLGSTSTGVLHGAPCDVLAVRVGQKGEQTDE
ncbi:MULTISPECIES: universal stress protein [unclassified Halomonas]|uniref:universal stress protein n=1 Tax=unclassified Halomonas TaxID=2609666 RepID=UPI0021E35DCA|nr:MULTISPECIES: universal stress protein [unclassified Halomonas]UYG01137.1 universal stress protein [Halomonas sp. GD1P12]WNL37800.1 universal stress protein [Halomonas sp. PAMB 3232]WNL41116.1 universal stress protein [Halomonas sp. PAMB 3264]